MSVSRAATAGRVCDCTLTTLQHSRWSWTCCAAWGWPRRWEARLSNCTVTHSEQENDLCGTNDTITYYQENDLCGTNDTTTYYQENDLCGTNDTVTYYQENDLCDPYCVVFWNGARVGQVRGTPIAL